MKDYEQCPMLKNYQRLYHTSNKIIKVIIQIPHKLPLQLIRLHGEIRVGVVVLHHIPNCLVKQGKERREGTHASEVHDMLQVGGCVLQTLHNQSIGAQVRSNDRSNISLHL